MFLEFGVDWFEPVKRVFIKHIYPSTKVHDDFNGHRSVAQPFGCNNTMVAISKQCFVFYHGKFKRSKSMRMYIARYILYIMCFYKRENGHRSFVSSEFAVAPKYINGDVCQFFVDHCIVPPSKRYTSGGKHYFTRVCRHW